MRKKRIILFLLIIGSVMLASCTGNTASNEDTLLANLDKIVEGWNNRDATAFEDLIAEDFVRTSQGKPHFQGRDGFEELMQGFSAAFEDQKVTLTSKTVHGNQVFTSWTVSGTHTGQFFEGEATGTQVDIYGYSVWTFDDNGVLISEDAYWDDLGTLTTLGFAMKTPDDMNPDEDTLLANLDKIVEGWNNRDATAFEDLIAEDFVRTSQGKPHFQGRDGFEELMQGFSAAFEDQKVTLTSKTVHGNQVFTSWTVSGTHTGQFFEGEATGTQVDIYGYSVWTFDDNGVLISEDAYWDDLGTLTTLGFTMSVPE